jgi:hypothetical protein
MSSPLGMHDSATIVRLRRQRCRVGYLQGPQQPTPRAPMQLISYYIVFMIVGDLAAYLIGLLIEREFGSQVSLIAFLLLYFGFLWVAWIFAVRLTEPKRKPEGATA